MPDKTEIQDLIEEIKIWKREARAEGDMTLLVDFFDRVENQLQEHQAMRERVDEFEEAIDNIMKKHDCKNKGISIKALETIIKKYIKGERDD